MKATKYTINALLVAMRRAKAHNAITFKEYREYKKRAKAVIKTVHVGPDPTIKRLINSTGLSIKL